MSFRKDFVWGAATAAYQIEGAAYEDGRGESVWDVHCHDTRKNPEGKQNILDGETGDVSCDFYHHYKEDIQRMKNMGLKAFRFSISWSRVLPDGTGRVNEKGLQFYSDLVDALLEAEIEPWVTLFHWDFPQQLQIRGGWQNPESPEWFAEYTKVIVDRLSDRVSHWMTLNEPQCHLIIGHVQGNCAPKLRLTEPEYLLAIHNHLKAHGRAVQVIRKYAKKKPEIGVAFCFGSSVPVSDQPEDVKAARIATLREDTKDLWAVSWWLDPVILGHYPEKGMEAYGENCPEELRNPEDLKLISEPLDFLGINVYQSGRVESDGQGGYREAKNPCGAPVTAMKWQVTPESLYYVAKFLQEKYKLPIVITENGLSCPDWVFLDGKVHDPMRIDFMHRYLSCLKKAAEEGTDIWGYFAWSAIDNMEWNNGYTERFGLIYVDYTTQKRILKDSAYWYHEVIGSNGENL